MKRRELSERAGDTIFDATVILLLTTLVAVYRSRSHPLSEVVIESVTALTIATMLFSVRRSRHVLMLWNVEPRTSIAELARLRPLASRGQRLLADEYRHFRARFLILLAQGQLSEATYREQMEFARIFYATHRRRFWATTLDPWSEFVRANEAYARIMKAKADATPDIADASSGATEDIPLRARLFILPAKRFVADVIKDPAAARELIRCHFRSWKTVPHVLLLDGVGNTCWNEMLTIAKSAGPELSTIIPDFMLVDDSFVYGRVAPEILEDQVPMNRSLFTLGFCDLSTERESYAGLFAALWRKSSSVVDFANAMLSMRAGTSSAIGPSSLTSARAAVGGHSDGDAEKLYDVLANAKEDVEDFLGQGLREERYGQLFSESRAGKPLGEVFIEQMRSATKPCYAIDQADVKDESRRFPATWSEEHYMKWRKAFASDGSTVRRRIYVVRDWNLGDDPFLTALLMEEVCKNFVEVGLILHRDLLDFAARTRGIDAAVHDAEWIIINTYNTTGHPVVGERTVGVSLGAREIKRDAASSSDVQLDERDFILTDKMAAYLQWHEKLWDHSEGKLTKLSDLADVQRFLEMLRAFNPAA